MAKEQLPIYDEKPFTIDLSLEVDVYSKQCFPCVHLTDPINMKCKAYPDGIPVEIWNNEISHRQRLPGDHGIQFEQRKT